MVNIALVGCNGKMGKAVTSAVQSRNDCEIVFGADPFGTPAYDYPVFESLAVSDKKADVIIDFSNPASLDDILAYALEKKIPCVLCTTGYSPEQVEKIKKASESVAVFYSGNMSLGINLLIELSKEAAKILGAADFDIEIVEKHHNQKLDAPSGTALALADSMNEALNEKYAYVYDRSRERKKREKYEIGISAVRGGNIVGEHEVIFAGQDEVIEFKHTAYSKAVFAKGAVQAAKFLAGKPAGFYDMSDVIQAQ